MILLYVVGLRFKTWRALRSNVRLSCFWCVGWLIEWSSITVGDGWWLMGVTVNWTIYSLLENKRQNGKIIIWSINWSDKYIREENIIKSGHLDPTVVAYRGSAKKRAQGFVNFVSILSYQLWIALPAAFKQPGARLLSDPCTGALLNFNLPWMCWGCSIISYCSFIPWYGVKADPSGPCLCGTFCEWRVFRWVLIILNELE